jgi:hypothetical protein
MIGLVQNSVISMFQNPDPRSFHFKFTTAYLLSRKYIKAIKAQMHFAQVRQYHK